MFFIILLFVLRYINNILAITQLNFSYFRFFMVGCIFPLPVTHVCLIFGFDLILLLFRSVVRLLHDESQNFE